MALDNLFFTAVYRSLNKSEEQFLNNRIEKVYSFENDRTEIISTILDCSVTRVDIRLLTTGIANLSTMAILLRLLKYSDDRTCAAHRGINSKLKNYVEFKSSLFLLWSDLNNIPFSNHAVSFIACTSLVIPERMITGYF